MKLYFLFASRRDRQSNMAKISYDKIEEYSGVNREHIKRALTILGANSLVHIEHVPSGAHVDGVASAYRLVHLHSRQHMGTWGARCRQVRLPRCGRRCGLVRRWQLKRSGRAELREALFGA